MSNNNNNNGNNPPKRPRKRNRWYGNTNANGNKHQKIDPPPAKNVDDERLENEKQVANMEKQLHEYFHKTGTPYTYIDDTGVYKFTPPPAPAPPVVNPFMNLTFNPFIPSTTPLFSMPLWGSSPLNVVAGASAAPAAEIKEVFIREEINHIDDLIALCDKYPLSETVKYNINMKAIHAIRRPLTDLTNMIGMDTIKKSIVDQILYYLQELHIPVVHNAGADTGAGADAGAGADTTPADAPAASHPFADTFLFPMKKKLFETCDTDFAAPTKGDFMHTVIYGPPGSGKTEVAKIIGRIFSNLGILTKKTFKKVSRNDLVAGYLGQTAIKTKDIIKASIGGVLFIDEAYSLGNSEKRDSFAKECVDTLCEALSEHKHNWMVIIAGYEKELNDCFFSLNEGLNSRFTWRFKLDSYKPGELKSIYEKQVRDFGWTIASTVAASAAASAVDGHGLREDWFAANMDYFTTYGRDMETLFTKTKIAHSRRVFCLPPSAKTEITMTDLENGFKLFIENPEVKERANSHGGSYMKTLYL